MQSGEVSREDESSDDEEIKDLVKHMNISKRETKELTKQKFASASPISSNASDDEVSRAKNKMK